MYFKYSQMTFFSSVICLLIKLTAAHLDQQCHFGMCLNSLLVPIKNAYCDNDNRCRCEDGFVPVSTHRCAQIQLPGQPCERDNVCRTKDENSFCDSNRRFPICECKKGFMFNVEQKKCIPYVKNSKRSNSLFPMTAIILIACIGIFCGCGIICHNFRRHPEISGSVQHIGTRPRRTSRTNAAAGVGSNRNNHTSNDPSDPTSNFSHAPMLRSDSHSSSSKYDDSLLYDEPPPRYEDAIKEYSPMASSTINHHQQQQTQQSSDNETTTTIPSPIVITVNPNSTSTTTTFHPVIAKS